MRPWTESVPTPSRRSRSRKQFDVSLAGASLLGALTLFACGQQVEATSDVAFEDGQKEDEKERIQVEDDIVLEELEKKTEDQGEECERQLRLAEVQVGEPEPFDVIIVADHSESLSWSRDDLAAGLSNFLGQMHGHEVRFFVLTPTQYDETSKAARLPLGQKDVVQWQDPESGESYENAMTRYSQVCHGADGLPLDCPVEYEDITVEYTIEGTWNFVMPEPIARITSAMDEAALDVQRRAISDAILGLGLGGSSYEQPLCTLSRYLAQSPDLLPEHAVFLILSDEDDRSDPADCAVRFEADAHLSPKTERFLVRAPGVRERRSFACTAENDRGELVGDPKAMTVTGGECLTDRDCTPEELLASEQACPVGHRASDCAITCAASSIATCTIEKSDAIPDACNLPFVYDGQTYENLVDYCQSLYPDATEWDACQPYESGGGVWFGHRLHPLSVTPTQTGVINEWKGLANTIFGPEGYSVQLIGFDPSFSCAPQAGQSYLDNLKGLLEPEQQVFSICEDYSGALAQVRDFASKLLPNEYRLDLSPGETVREVRILSADGSTRTLLPSEFTYDQLTGMLHIQRATLRTTDSGIDLEVEEPCVIR